MKYLTTLSINVGYYDAENQYVRTLITSIKALRRVTGLGLREAKNILDSLHHEHSPLECVQVQLVLSLEQLGALAVIQVQDAPVIICVAAEPFEPQKYIDCSTYGVMLP